MFPGSEYYLIDIRWLAFSQYFHISCIKGMKMNFLLLFTSKIIN